MSGQRNAIRHDGRATRTVLRIAIPAWGPGQRKRHAEIYERPCREEFKRLLDAALLGSELSKNPLTRSERRQVDVTRKLRDALYSSPGLV